MEEESKIPKQIQPLTSYDSKGTRFTCVALADGDVMKENGKRGKEEDGNENENEDEGSGEDWEGVWGGIKQVAEE